jgi:hypothetical protein
MKFLQQIQLFATAPYGAPTAPVIWGFSNDTKTRVSLQATFLDSNNNLIAPTSAEIYLNASLDGLAFGPDNILDWNTASATPNQSGDVVDHDGGPWRYIALNWNISWGSAVSAYITVAAMAESQV